MFALLLLSLTNSAFYSSNFEPYPAYQCSGEIELPYSNIVEPFNIHYDSSTESSSINYYNTSRFLSSKLYGSTVILPTSYNGVQGVTCLRGEGSQSVFPNLKNFEKQSGAFECHSNDGKLNSGGPCFVWKMEETNFARNNTYLFFADEHLNPKRYEMFGYDSLFGSHYDKYFINYHDYSEYPSKKVDKEIMDLVHQYCNFQEDQKIKKDLHIDLISEIFDQERAKRVHKVHFEATISTNSMNFQSKDELRNAELNHLHSLRFVMSHNRKNSPFKLEVNFKSLQSLHSSPGFSCRLKTGSTPAAESLFHGYTELNVEEDLPNSWDWRAYGAVSPIKDQAICGSCWSFATTGVIESQFFVKTNNSVLFSEQQLVDCSWGQHNNGCFGGLDTNSYHYIKSYGLASNDEYGPYKGMDMGCKQGPFTQHFKLKGFKRVPNHPKAIMAALYKEGPLSISIDASPKSFGFYKSGVYDDGKCSSTDLDHAVLLVGYKLTENGKGYWIVKNSWSTNWGNQGYIFISMENNICGVGTEVTLPIFE